MKIKTNSPRLDNEQQQALNALLAGRNVFLSGEAGTGKTVVIREFEKHCRKQLVKLAPTGIAAQNIGGSTIHSFFKFNIGVQDPQQPHEIPMNQYLLLKTVEVILIDEISMVRSDIFTAMDAALREVNEVDLPFGGRQVILVGDFCQLPPIVQGDNLKTYFQETFDGKYAFQTRTWQEAGFEEIMLEKVYRQNDEDYEDLLYNVRRGITSYEGMRIIGENSMKPDYYFYDQIGIFEDINERCYNSRWGSLSDGYGFDIADFAQSDSVAICCTRSKAQQINDACLAQLEDEGLVWRALRSGYYPDDELPTAHILNIKLGERIMILANKSQSPGIFEHVNGDVGVVTDYEIFNGKPQVMVELKNGKRVKVEQTLWCHYEYQVETDEYGEHYITQVETGSFLQLPLTPAYAITIHKAQGQSIDKLHLVLGEGCFAEGQLYTALSRGRNLKDVTLDRPILERDLIFDWDVHELYGYHNLY
jgi:ATP-dependent exoDNAse (exonuclease V) alpha subunit